MSEIPIGIDLGTTTSEIGYYKHGRASAIQDPESSGSFALPSVVALNDTGELVVGRKADSYISPGRVVREVKRLMGTQSRVAFGRTEHRPEEIAALILRQLKRNAEELGVPVSKAVLSVPANFNDAAKNATFEAGRLAGLEITRLIAEPTAAALAYGIVYPEKEEQILVFDFGGGTLDISIVELLNGVLQAKSVDGDEFLGGKDFDQALAHLILRRFMEQHPTATIREEGRLALKRIAEQAKKALSVTDSVVVSKPNFVEGDKHLEMEITRREFEAAASQLLERARTCLQNSLKVKNVRPSDIDKVLLVGGATFIPAVRRLVTEMMGKEPKVEVDPELAVCIGASIQAGILSGDIAPEKSIILADVARFGLGVEIANVCEGRLIEGVYSPLMQPNQAIPYSRKENYSLLHPTQTAVEIHLFQDRTGRARRTKDAEDTGIKGSITGIPPSSSGIPHKLEVDFSYDVNGLVRVRSIVPETGQVLSLIYDKSAVRLDDAERSAARARVDGLWQGSGDPGPAAGIIRRAEKALEVVGLEYRDRIQGLVEELKASIADGRSDVAKRLQDQLTDLLFDIEDLIDGN